MKRLLLVLLVLIFLLTTTSCTAQELPPITTRPPTTTTTTTHSYRNASVTVYITKSGECYHRDGCRSLWNSGKAVTLKTACENGYRPCQICSPPSLE